jgi:hypothetical protein
MIGVIRGLARRIAAVVAECRHAQHRMAVLHASPERYRPHAACAPATYREFLFWTSGLLAHEPTAASRSAGSADCPRGVSGHRRTGAVCPAASR